MSVSADVDRGLEIRATLEKLTSELKDIETRLQMAALQGAQVDLKDADREGKQYLAAGTVRVVPVIITADSLVGQFTANGEAHRTIAAAAGGQLTQFFKPFSGFKNRFESGKKFRIHAAEVLGLAAPQFITACVARDKDGIAKSAVKIMWEEDHAKP